MSHEHLPLPSPFRPQGGCARLTHLLWRDHRHDSTVFFTIRHSTVNDEGPDSRSVTAKNHLVSTSYFHSRICGLVRVRKHCEGKKTIIMCRKIMRIRTKLLYAVCEMYLLTDTCKSASTCFSDFDQLKYV